MPIGIRVSLAHMLQQCRIVSDRKCPSRARIPSKAQIIRVHVDQNHASMLSHPIELFEPNVWGELPKNQKKSRILRQAVGELDISSTIRAVRRRRHPKREDRPGGGGLRLKGVCIESRGIVLDIEIVQPIEFVEHEAGSKPGCGPFLHIGINSRRVLAESLAGLIEFAVMMQIMNADFESPLPKPRKQFRGNGVRSLGYEIEGRSKAMFRL